MTDPLDIKPSTIRLFKTVQEHIDSMDLNDIEKKVARLRFNIDSLHTLREAAKVLGIEPLDVRKIEQSIMRKIAKRQEEENG